MCVVLLVCQRPRTTVTAAVTAAAAAVVRAEEVEVEVVYEDVIILW